MARRDGKTVLFLCTGNYYRSRVAEILFTSVAIRMGLPWQGDSRALALERGVDNIGPIAKEAVQVLGSLGVRAPDAMARMPKQVLPGDLEQATRIVALKQTEHQPLLLERFPDWAGSVEFWHVDDAPGVLGLIEGEVMGLVARIMGGGERPAGSGAASPVTRSPISPVAKPPKPILLKVGRETAGRRGKGVTTVFDTPLNEDKLKDLAAILKQRCGTGGTVKDGKIEIQGDQRERIVAELEKLGYQVKRVGG